MRGRSHSFNLFIDGYDDSLVAGQAPAKSKPVSARKTKMTKAVDLTGFKAVVSKKSGPDEAFLTAALKRHYLFSELGDKERGNLIDVMRTSSFDEGTTIAAEGDPGVCLFICRSGEVTESVEGNDTGKFKEGDVFAETCIIRNSPRVRTFVAASDCVLFSLDQKSFLQMQSKENASENQALVDVLKKQPFLSDLTHGDLDKLAHRLHVERYSSGDYIFKKGEEGDSFFIVEEGEGRMTDIGFGKTSHADEVIGPGDFFGGRALVTGEKRWMNVIADSDMSVMCITRKVCEDVIGDVQTMLKRNVKKRFLKSVPVFATSSLAPFETEELVDLMEDVEYKKGDIIKETDVLLLIFKGAMTVAYQNGEIINLHGGDHIGGYNLKSLERPNHVITVEEDSVCHKLTRDQVKSVMKDLERLGKPMPPVSSNFDKSITLDRINMVRIVGQGGFGIVWVCTLDNDTTKPYALKCMWKKKMSTKTTAGKMIREKNLLASIDHPFVSGIISAFQDDLQCYMFQDFLVGGELWTVIKEDYGIPEKNAQFYAACVLDGVSYLHKRGVYYRDLKPENVLIDTKGYGILIDMGLAKVCDTTTFTMCGTPEYMAPELILGKGHNQSVDNWALGVLIFEMIAGDTPFFDSDETTIFRKIVQVRYNMPYNVGDDVKDLIEKLLVKEGGDEVRLGSNAGGDENIRKHKFFDGVDWDSLREKKVPAPWIPEVEEDPLDTGYFDEDIEEEDIDMDEMELDDDEQALFENF